MHVAGKGKPAHQGKRSKAVDDVVDIESVARPLAVTDSGECAVERVAQPVQRKAGDDAQQGITTPCSQGVADSGANLRRQTENGEMVGADPGRRVSRQPEQYPFLWCCCPAFLETEHIGDETFAAHLDRK